MKLDAGRGCGGLKEDQGEGGSRAEKEVMRPANTDRGHGILGERTHEET